MRHAAATPGHWPTRWWTRLDDGRVRCDVCPRACALHEGQHGLCFVRARDGDAIVTAFEREPVRLRAVLSERSRRVRGVEAQRHAIVNIHVNCDQRRGGSTLYVTATEEHFDVKSLRQSSSIGFPVVAPIYYGTQSEADAQVKTHGETVSEREFYERFYRAVQRELSPSP